MPPSSRPATPSVVTSPSALALGRKEQVLAYVGSSPDLATPPAIALRIIDLASDADCAADELAELISSDPALCAKVLRTVNSALYGLRTPVSSVPQAVRFLGAHPLRSLVIAFTLSKVFSSPLPREALQTHWRVSVAGALAARQLARAARRPASDNDFVAGLLRDLGALALHQLFPAEYASILEASPEVLSGFRCELEEEALRVNHAEVSAALLNSWRLPAEITEPVRCHHDLARADALTGDLRERARRLYFASQIGQMQLTPNRPMLVRELLALAGDLCGMDEPALRELLGDVQAQMSELAGALQVDIGTGLDFAQVMSRGVEELSRLASVTGQLAFSPPPWPEATSVGQAPGPVADPDAAGEPGATVVNPLAPHGAGGWSFEDWQARLFRGPAAAGRLGTLDGYEVTRLLGRGAMGAVYHAIDPRLQRPVALKVMLPNPECPQARDRFLHEGRAIAALTHENVVGVYGVGESNGVPYLVMEYVKGTTLAERLRREGALALPDIIRLGLETASGLAAAHGRGLVHRDIKPANLLLEEGTNRVKVADFGLAQRDGKSGLGTPAGELVGTPSFMSPEQADGRPTDARSDMFSLGCVLYLASTGRLPFNGATVWELFRALLETSPLSVRAVSPALPEWLEEIIHGLLTKDPQRRYPTAWELKRVLLCRWARLVTTRATATAAKHAGALTG